MEKNDEKQEVRELTLEEIESVTGGKLNAAAITAEVAVIETKLIRPGGNPVFLLCW